MADSRDNVRLATEVRDRMYTVRSQMQRSSLLRSGFAYAVFGLLALIAIATLDYFQPQPWLVRVLAATTVAIAGFVVLVRWVKNRDQIDDLVAAKEIEQANPQLGQRLRTSHQFDQAMSDVPVSTAAANDTATQSDHATKTPELTSALIDQTNQIVTSTKLDNPVQWGPVKRWCFALAALLLVVTCTLVGMPETRTTLARMMMVPVHYSNLDVAELEPIVAGEDASFSAILTGRPLENVELWIREPDSQAWTKLPMLPQGVNAEDAPAELKGELTAKVDACEADLVYKVVASPLPPITGSLTVLQPLEQKKFQATVEPPTYTGVDATTVTEMEFSVVEGSLVGLALELSRPPAEAQLIPSGASATPVPLTIDGAKLTCDLAQLEESESYEVQAAAADGMKFRSDRIRIRVKKDKGPTVAFQKPKEELSVFATTEVGLNLRVSDDFGLGKVGIEYQINGGKKETLWENDVQGAGKTLTTLPVMYLEEHELSHEDAITYFAFAEDNHPEPRRTRTALQFIDIQPYKQEFQVVEGNCQGSCDCLTLEELIKRQRHNLSRTFVNIDRQPVQDSLSKRLALSQREIQEATDEFKVGWEQKFGPMPMLGTASEFMVNAAGELDQKSLDMGMQWEEAALVELIRAKQNVRKFLKNCSKSSGEFSKCKQFDTSMAQRIRKPDVKKQEAEKSIAKTREEIREMAEQQKRFSEEVAAASGGAKLDKKPSQPSAKPSSKPGASSPSSSQGLAKSQQSAAKSAQEMQEAMQKNATASELAQQRMDEASEKIRQSAEEMQKGNQVAAAEQAKQAAELLEQLDEHLKGLSGEDLAQRMAVAEQMASRLASAESQVSQALASRNGDKPVGGDSPKPSEGSQGTGSQGTGSQGSQGGQAGEGSPRTESQELASTQRRLTQQTETLADLMRHLEADALGENLELRRGLGDLQSETLPEEIAAQMNEVTTQIAGDDPRASKGAGSAARQLEAVASGLGSLRRSAMQPKLDELMAAEAKTAKLLEDIKANQDQAALTQAYEQLQGQLARLGVSPSGRSPSEKPGSGQTGSGNSSQGGNGTPSAPFKDEPRASAEPQFSYAGTSRNAELRDVLSVLQSQIQDAILLTARMDADEPVPAKYRELVNEYYQSLSDDLR